jgi:hypothetical protein
VEVPIMNCHGEWVAASKHFVLVLGASGSNKRGVDLDGVEWGPRTDGGRLLAALGAPNTRERVEEEAGNIETGREERIVSGGVSGHGLAGREKREVKKRNLTPGRRGTVAIPKIVPERTTVTSNERRIVIGLGVGPQELGSQWLPRRSGGGCRRSRGG